MSVIESLSQASPLYTYLGVFLLMLTNGVSSFPSSQFLYIFSGYLSSFGTLSLWTIVTLGALGNTFGNIIQYELVRYKGVEFSTKHLSIKKVTFDRLNSFVQKHGVFYLAIGKLIPGIKVVVPLVAGLTKISRIFIYLILFFSSFIWAAIFVHIGAFFGTHSNITKWYTLCALLIIFCLYLYTYLRYPYLFKDLPERSSEPKTNSTI